MVFLGQQAKKEHAKYPTLEKTLADQDAVTLTRMKQKFKVLPYDTAWWYSQVYMLTMETASRVNKNKSKTRKMMNIKSERLGLREENSSDIGTSVMDPDEREPKWEVTIYIIITRFIVINIAPLTELFCNWRLFCNCPLDDCKYLLFKNISFNTKCLLVWCN